MSDAEMNEGHDLAQRWAEKQDQLWNGEMGNTWVAARSFIDGMLKPFEDLIVTGAIALKPERILDVGCGNGTTTFAMADALPGARVTGIDLSVAMTEAARSRASEQALDIEFIADDAAAHAFGGERFDFIVSRFGSMFFADPVSAFSNFRTAATDDARLQLIVWRAPDNNPFMTTGQWAAASLLPDPVPRDPRAPGPFAFADTDFVHGILEDSGWGEVQIEPLDLTCSFASSDLDLFVRKLAPIGADLSELDPTAVEEIYRTMTDAFREYEHGDGTIKFSAATYSVTATAAPWINENQKRGTL
jgi:SAM-dependent methyltransferase